MKNCVILMLLSIVYVFTSNTFALSEVKDASVKNDSVVTENAEKKIHFHIRPSLGLTYGESNAEGVKTSNLQWLGTVNSDMDYTGSKFDLSSTLFMQYGQSKINGQEAETLQDAFILSITPSIPIIKSL